MGYRDRSQILTTRKLNVHLNARELILKADGLLRRGAFGEALACFQNVITRVKVAGGVHNNMGICLYALRRYEEAIGAFKSAIACNPYDAEAHSNLANVYKAIGRMSEAIEHYQTALRLRPDYVQAYNNLAGAMHFVRRHEDAIATYRRAIALRPDYAAAYANLANVLNAVGERDSAVAAARKAIAINPLAPHAYNNLGVILRDAGRFVAAVRAFKDAIKLNPSFILAWNNLALTWLHMGNFNEAIAACEHSLKLEPINTQALAFKALALQSAGGAELAEPFLDFDAIVRQTTITPPSGFDDLQSYNAALAAGLQSRSDLYYEPISNTTRHGWQSLDMTRDASPSPLLTHLRRMIEAAVENYTQSISPNLPFMRARPQQSSLVIWVTVLEGGGFQEPHIHSDGWLSGVYYVQTPTQSCGRLAHAGAIEFGRAPGFVPQADARAALTLLPEPGLLLVFPSYIYHSTRPHEGEQKRISIAFDVVPA